MAIPSVTRRAVDVLAPRRAVRGGSGAARWALPMLVALTLSSDASARSVDEPMREAAERATAGDLEAARARYLDVLHEQPAHYPALWRLSRVESQLGEAASGERQRRLVADAVGHARAAIDARPDSAQGHLALAVALDRQTLDEGAKTRLALAREIKSEVDRALAIDPGLGRAYHVRAIWNRRLSSLSFFERVAAHTPVLGGVPKGASMDNAVHDLQKAIELEPNVIDHHLELGRTYLKLKRRSDAIRELERAMALPAIDSPRDPAYQSEARELLARARKH
jgi:tetratricopeptide (TPR) repeat protein